MAAFNGVRLTLLGGFAGQLPGGDAITLPTRKAEALLAFLALPVGQAHPRDKLAALLWEDLPRPDARARLRQALFAIRTALDAPGRQALRLDNDSVALDPETVTVDVATFERLAGGGDCESWRAAAALYRGDLLAGIAARETLFETWLRAERERLHERALETLARLVDGERRRGDTDGAIQAALQVLSLDPLQEVAHRALMRLYADTGRRAAALRQYRVCVDTLQRELGLEPEAETQSLYQEILQRRAAARPSLGAVPEPRRDAAPDAPRDGTPFVGRERELAALQQAMTPSGEGATHIAVVIGDAGIGKTRLVMEATSRAGADGVRIVVGRSHESQQILPFGPWADAFRAGYSAGDVEEFETLRPGWRTALSDLVYGLAGSGDRDVTRPHYLQVFEAVAELLHRLATKQPLVLVFEDVQWADELSVRLLAFVARVSCGWPFSIVLTIQAEELADAVVLRRALDELEPVAQVTRLTLPALSHAETIALAQAVDEAVAATRAEQIWLTSEGNALVAVEVVRALQQGLPLDGGGRRSVPERVRRLIEQRLERLGDDAQELVAVAATIGREFGFGLLERASELGEARAARALEELVRRRVVHEEGEAFAFTHDRIRHVAYARLLGPRRRVLHRRVGEALEQSQRPERHYGSLGVHFEHAETWQKAADYLGRAGHAAFERGAMRDAVSLFERALGALGNLAGDPANVATEIDLNLALHRALMPLGELGGTIARLRRAEDEARSIGDRHREAVVVVSMAEYFAMTGEHRRSAELSERALAMAAELRDAPLADQAHLRLGTSLDCLGDPHGAIEHFTATLEGVPDPADPRRFGYPYLPALRRIVGQLAALGEFAGAEDHARRAVAIAEARGDPWSLSEGYLAVGLLHLESLRTAERAIPALERALECARSAELGLLELYIAASLAVAHARAGQSAQAVAAIDVAARAEAVSAVMNLRTRRFTYLAEASMLVGALDEAGRYAEQAAASARDSEPGHEPDVLYLRARLAQRTGRADAQTVAGLYRAALQRAERQGLVPLANECRAALTALVGTATTSR